MADTRVINGHRPEKKTRNNWHIRVTTRDTPEVIVA